MVDALEAACDQQIAHLANVLETPNPLPAASGILQPRLTLDSPSPVAPPEIHHRNTRSTRIFYPYLISKTRRAVSDVGETPFYFQQQSFQRGCREGEGPENEGDISRLCGPTREICIGAKFDVEDFQR